jgi:hypothetical protein
MYRRIGFGLLAILQLLFSLDTLAQTARDEKTLWQPYYISPRTASESAALHINLSGEWQLGWRDTANSGVDELASQSKWIRARVPATVQMALHYAGELPHPYYNLNFAVERSNQSLVFPLRNVSYS